MNEASKTWNGGFIWLPREKYPDLQTTYETIFCDQQGCKYTAALFRKEFILSAPVKKMTLKVSASVKYRLSLNGQLLGRGPIMQGGDYGNTNVLDYWFYDVYTDTLPFWWGKTVWQPRSAFKPVLWRTIPWDAADFAFLLNWSWRMEAA